MKRILYLVVSALFLSTSLTFAQSAGISGSFNPSSISVGQTSTLTIQVGVIPGSGTYNAGDAQIQISVPTQFFSATNPPQGGSYSWTNSGPGVWTGTLNSTISSVETVTLLVTGTGATTAGAQPAVLNIFPQGANDLDGTGNNSASPTLLVTGSASSITISPATQNGTVGTPVTLTASGCTGGTYTWTPAGGTTGGTGNNTYTVNAAAAGSVTYTATCSSGGSGTSTINWQAGTPTCAANAGTLN